jgi:hypothetical protein
MMLQTKMNKIWRITRPNRKPIAHPLLVLALEKLARIEKRPTDAAIAPYIQSYIDSFILASKGMRSIIVHESVALMGTTKMETMRYSR